MGRASVIGAGAWGTAIANTLAHAGEDVSLLVYEKELADTINRDHVNDIYLPDMRIHENISATTDPETALAGADPVFFVVPSQHARTVLELTAKMLDGKTIVVATKGIEHESLSLMSDVVADCVAGTVDDRMVVLSGPSFAREVAAGMPAAVVAASRGATAAQRVQEIFRGSNLRVYASRDIVGVQIAGSVKNVIAIAAGISDGLGYGYNARAALITRGAVEIARLGKAMGARPETFAGLAGIGDLVLTCTGDLSRNRTVGLRLARGETLADIQKGMRQIAEGVPNAKCLRALAARYDVEMPISARVYAILYENERPNDAVNELMSRELKDE
ncbi:MAG: NAD(P)-dependent glycerol-3-phosphate dehydrogenase [Candidatus Hydrogenedentes bacterium]|nr:NAD(P)-dependent glycerol-3-phosphate dehydrogenase [Candidatus Hydrogenedentota bacterium]